MTLNSIKSDWNLLIFPEDAIPTNVHIANIPPHSLLCLFCADLFK